MLLHQTLPHPVRGVALLDGPVPVRLEPGIYDPGDGSITGQAGSFSRRYLGSCPANTFRTVRRVCPVSRAICRMLFL